MRNINATVAVAAAGASTHILNLTVDANTLQGRLTFNLSGAIAQFESVNILEHQKVGIKAPKA